MPIRILDSVVASRIAAGEIIERPSSALRELLDNAIDSGASKISVWIEEGGIRSMTVSDNGCGIPKESIEHIFDKFYQVDSSHFRKGNGLGLAMVKSILQLLDGSIHVESEPGKGTLFTVTLSNHSPESVTVP